MWVGPDHLFSDHSPIYVRFQIQQQQNLAPKLFVPADWSELDIDLRLFEQKYKEIAAHRSLQPAISDLSLPEENMRLWSHAIESALDRTLRQMHAENPTRYPLKSLAPKYKGRCQPPLFVKPTPIRSVRHDPTQAYNPPGEPTALKTCQKVRQARRIASLCRQLQRQLLKCGSWDTIPPEAKTNLRHEWNRIKVPLLSQDVPTLGALHLMSQLTRHEAELATR